jgi:hypothetical protein
MWEHWSRTSENVSFSTAYISSSMFELDFFPLGIVVQESAGVDKASSVEGVGQVGSVAWAHYLFCAKDREITLISFG